MVIEGREGREGRRVGRVGRVGGSEGRRVGGSEGWRGGATQWWGWCQQCRQTPTDLAFSFEIVLGMVGFPSDRCLLARVAAAARSALSGSTVTANL